MKKLLVIILGFLFGISSAQTNGKSLLWKISGNGLKHHSYLYGTIHITCDATLPEKVKNALDKTDQLCLELDMDDTNMQTEMMGGMMMKDGVTMQSLTSKEDFEIVDAFLTKNLGFSAKMLNTLKPFMVSAMLYPRMISCEMQSVEGALINITKEQKEETIGLETITEQLNVFDAIPYQDQMNELVKTAKSDLSRDVKGLNEMLELYKTEDIEAMYTFTQQSENVLTSQFDDELLNSRNQNWIARISKIAHNKATFFGVGAAHLGGEKGVINLLRKYGFTVEPVH
ncbi:MAG: TraB/GumN family protein [Flavobacterium sp.]|nr:TraB/GumN family protein [Flavobacterium sp.]